MKRKRHGLWQFHRALNCVNKQYRAAWWKPEEIDRAANQVDFKINGYSKSWASPAAAIRRSAYRYIRRYKLPRNAITWNQVCIRIAKRMNAHDWSLRSALVECARDKSPICLVHELDVRPHYTHKESVRERLFRFLKYFEEKHKARIEIEKAIKAKQLDIRYREYTKITNDNWNLRKCRKLIKQIKEQLDETAKNHRTAS